MRTQVIGLLFLGITSLMTAQTSADDINVDDEINNVELNNLVISANSKYMNKAYDENASNTIKNLEQIVASFKIKNTSTYSSEFDSYLVNFRNDKTAINTVYNSDGTILSSNEKFKDVLMPHTVRQALYKEYPGWTIHKNSYHVSYSENRNVKKLYKIQVRKDGEKKNLKVDIVNNAAIVSTY